MTAMARATSHVGLVSTVSTTFSEPFLAARMLASLDHISGGRVGWNVVTSMFDAEARNHGMEALPGHGQRYERAAEFIEVALRLWDSWDDEALVLEPDGMYADPALVRPIDHAGEHFRVSGPLTVPRSSQGRPVLFHAGASGPGRELAARYAEGIYAVAYDLPAAQSDYADLKKRIGSAGRDPASVAVMPGLVTYVGSTEAEAVAKQSRADALLPAKQPLAQLAPSSGRTAPVGNWTPRSPNCPRSSGSAVHRAATRRSCGSWRSRRPRCGSCWAVSRPAEGTAPWSAPPSTSPTRSRSGSVAVPLTGSTSCHRGYRTTWTTSSTTSSRAQSRISPRSCRAATPGSGALVMARTTTMRLAPALRTSGSRSTSMPPMANHGVPAAADPAMSPETSRTEPRPVAGRPGLVGVSHSGPVQK